MKFDPAKAAGARCLLIKGTDGALVVQALAETLKLHKASHDALPEVFTADSVPPAEWVGKASSASFFTEIQVVVVRNLGRVNPSKVWDVKEAKSHPFAKELAALPDFARLILVGDEEAGSPEKQASAKDSCDRWSRLVEAGGGMVASLEINPRDTAALISSTAKEKGLTLSSSAAQKLSLMVGGQAGLALAELEKAALFVSPRTTIREADLEAIVMPEPDYNVFQLAESIVQGNPGRALKELAVATDIPASSIQSEAIARILPTVHRQLKLVWQARLCLDARCSPSDPPESVLRQFPDRPLLHKEKDWVQQKSVTLARGVPLRALALCFEELSRADAKLKGVLPAFSAKETLENMVLSMASHCGAGRQA